MAEMYYQKPNKSIRVDTLITFLLSVFFTIYNGVVGFHYKQIYSIFIFFYFVIMNIILGIIVVRFFLTEKLHNDNLLFIVTHAAFLIMDASLFIPVILMVFFKTPIQNPYLMIGYGLYVLYKIIHAIMGFVKRNKTQYILYRELKTIYLNDAMLSVLTLINMILTYIASTTNDLYLERVLPYISMSLGLIFIILALVFTIISFVNGMKIIRRK